MTTPPREAPIIMESWTPATISEAALSTRKPDNERQAPPALGLSEEWAQIGEQRELAHEEHHHADEADDERPPAQQGPHPVWQD
jgi:hypothetical protein